jgi:hypothetical protein
MLGPTAHERPPITSAFPHENSKEARADLVASRGDAATSMCNASSHQGSSRYAYVTLLAFPSSLGYNDYLVSALVAAQSIRDSGSTYDIVALIYGSLSAEDEMLLTLHGIKV